jgi:hypothetical protein
MLSDHDREFVSALLAELLWAVARRLDASRGFAARSLTVHPLDHRAIRVVAKPSEMEVTRDGPTFLGLRFLADPAIRTGSAAIGFEGGDCWQFHWDRRWRCGRCGKELPNDQNQDPASSIQPICSECAPLVRPGLYGNGEAAVGVAPLAGGRSS